MFSSIWPVQMRSAVSHRLTWLTLTFPDKDKWTHLLLGMKYSSLLRLHLFWVIFGFTSPKYTLFSINDRILEFVLKCCWFVDRLNIWTKARATPDYDTWKALFLILWRNVYAMGCFVAHLPRLWNRQVWWGDGKRLEWINCRFWFIWALPLLILKWWTRKQF